MDGCEVEMLICFSTSQMRNRILGRLLFFSDDPLLVPWLWVTGRLWRLSPFSGHAATGCYRNVNQVLPRLHFKPRNCLSKQVHFFKAPKSSTIFGHVGKHDDYIQLLKYILFESAVSL